MKIGVSGASGQLGKAVLKELIGRGGGHAIVGISRTPTMVLAPVQGRHGDYDQPDSLVLAYAGLDRLLIIPSADLAPGARARQLVAAIDAGVQAGVGHIVLVSSAGTRQAAEPAVGAAYWIGEQHLMKTAARWTVLRMNFYAEAFGLEVARSLATGMLTGLGENRVAFVSRDDVGAAAAGLLLGEGHAGAVYEATGPAAICGAERAALVAELTGKPFGYVIISEAQLRGGLAKAGLTPELVETVVGLRTKFVDGDFDVVSGCVERLAGRPPRTLSDVLRTMLA
ncbi:NAD(P)H-binding protein [Paucibacter sp. R3-3]|uniref:NAD(P)H-binding protein n=1 Tax=Roseateles agri TaxID=3098619 RepID=A0ABU5DSQ1_9BURK|nr:NAD(P)H-binding protein [Paucibacter sp. R3-3]MDY0748122.1 NAD(P)H-binding protein [Paucibacter sp. R3-3]